MLSRILAVILFVSVTWSPAAAEVTRIEVQSRADLVAGKAFGTVGPYEKLTGKIYFEVDPPWRRTESSPTSTRLRETRAGA
jgi:hypothetical protein